MNDFFAASQGALEHFWQYLTTIPSRRYLGLLTLLAVVGFGCNLELRHFSGADEPRVAGVSAAYTYMADWRVPFLNGEPFLEQPPLFYWCQAGLFEWLGPAYWVGKLPSVLMAIAAVLGVYGIARRMRAAPWNAFAAGVMLLSCLQFWDRARNSTVDMMLAGFIVLSVWCFCGIWTARSWWRRAGWCVAMALMLGAGFMTKGLVGMAVPAVGVGGFLLLSDLWERHFSWRSWLALAVAGALSLLGPLWWGVELFQAAGADAVNAIYWDNNFGRFFGRGGFADHGGPWYEYLVRLPEYFSVWQIFLPIGLICYARRGYLMLRKRRLRVGRDEVLYGLLTGCMVLLPFVLFSLSSGKRTVYLLVLYPFEALWLAPVAMELFGLADHGFGLYRKREWHWRGRRWSLVTAGRWAALVAAGALVLCGAVMVVCAMLWGLWSAAVSAALVMLTGGVGVWNMLGWNFGRAALGLLVGGALMLGTLDVFDAANREESYEYMFALVKGVHDTGRPVALFDPNERERGAAVYYLQEDSPVVEEPDQALAMLRAGYCVVFGSALTPAELDALLPPGTRRLEWEIRGEIFSAAVLPLEKTTL